MRGKCMQKGLAALMLLASLVETSGGKESPSALLPHHPGGDGWSARPGALGGSPFAGLTIHEAIAMMGTRSQGPEALATATPASDPAAPADIPASFDLRDRHGHCGALTRVLNQGACGSCYAMASTQAVSAALCVGSEGWSEEDDALMSTQDVLACSGVGGPKLSCWGGTISAALAYLCEAGAVEESCVPYTAGFTWRDSQSVDTCRRTCAIPQAHVRRRAVHNATAPSTDGGGGGGRVRSACEAGTALLNSEAQIKHSVMSVGPAVAYMDVYRSFLHYSNGVYTCPQPSRCMRSPSKKGCPLTPCAANPDCALTPPGPTCADCHLGGHAVQIVGWGVNATTGAGWWLVKNSWGAGWGEGGHFRISAAPEQNCNLVVDCADPARAPECFAGVSPNNPYAPAPGVRASEPQVPRWEALAAWALCLSSALSALASGWLLATVLSHAELRQYPFNRLALAAAFLLPLSLAQAAFLPMEALFLVDNPLACALAGRAYVGAALGFAGTCAATALAGLVNTCAPIERGEGCGDGWPCGLSGLAFAALAVGLPAGLCAAQALTLDSAFWPSPLRCAMHSQLWTQLLFDAPMAACLAACALAVLTNLALSTRNPEPYSREWTEKRVQAVLLVGVAVWVPGAALAALVALDIPTGQTALVVVEALCTGLAGAIFTAAAIRALDLDLFLYWKALNSQSLIPEWPHASEVSPFLPGGQGGQNRLWKNSGNISSGPNPSTLTFYEGWGEAVRVDSGWHGSMAGLSPQGSGSTESELLSESSSSAFSSTPGRGNGGSGEWQCFSDNVGNTHLAMDRRMDE